MTATGSVHTTLTQTHANAHFFSCVHHSAQFIQHCTFPMWAHRIGSRWKGVCVMYSSTLILHLAWHVVVDATDDPKPHFVTTQQPTHRRQHWRNQQHNDDNNDNTLHHIATRTNTHSTDTPHHTMHILLSSTDTGPRHSKWHEACTGISGQLFLAWCDHVRPTGNEPKYMHSGPQGKSERVYHPRHNLNKLFFRR